MSFGVTKIAKLCRRTAYLSLIAAQAIQPSLAFANHENGNLIAQAYFPAGEYQTREIQPALNPIPSAQLRPGADLLLWAGNVRHQQETDFSTLQIQPDLNLGVAYNHRFTLNLEAQKTGGGRGQVPDGWYQINLVVVKQKGKGNLYQRATGLEDLNPYERYVTSASRVDYISSGRLVRTFTLQIPNITASAMKSHLYVQLIPLSKDCKRNGIKFPCITTLPGKPYAIDSSKSVAQPLPGVTPYLIEMPFVPLLTSGSADGNPELAPGADDPDIVTDIGKYVMEAKQYQALKGWGRAGLALKPADYARQSGLVFASLNDADFKSRFPKADVILDDLFTAKGLGTLRLTSRNTELASFFCSLLAEKDVFNLAGSRIFAWMENGICARDFEQYFSITRVTHFTKLNGQRPPKLLYSYPTTFSLMANFMFSRSRTEDVASTYSLKPLEPIKKAAGLIVKPLEAFGITSVFDWGYSLSRSDARAQSESALGSNSISLDFNVSAFNLNVLQATQCLEIRLTKAVLNKINPRSKGVYLCGSEQRELSLNELYVHAFSYNKDTSTAESYSPRSQAANYSFRGDRDITLFFQLIRSRVSADHDSRDFPFYAFEKADEFFGNRPATQPMLIAQPVTFQKDPPSLAAKLFGAYSERFLNDDN